MPGPAFPCAVGVCVYVCMSVRIRSVCMGRDQCVYVWCMYWVEIGPSVGHGGHEVHFICMCVYVHACMYAYMYI